MRLGTLHIVAGLLALLAFLLAFMAAGAFVASALFMILGLLALGWLAYSLIRELTGRDRRPPTTPPARPS